MNKQHKVIKFNSNGVECIASKAFGDLYSLNMRTCIITFETRPSVNIEYLPGATRVLINEGQVWFDTKEDSAAQIEDLFSN